jgi:stage V sporulation protein R
MAVQHHIDPAPHIKAVANNKCNCQPSASEYDDLWELEHSGQWQCNDSCSSLNKRVPEEDLMLFLLKQARDLDDWQRDIISVLRDEMLYFWPQMQTKIMNEGWASYWHLRIMREMDLEEAEALDFAKMHAGVILPSANSINPYLLGLKIFEDIARRWRDETDINNQGKEKIFEVRSIDNDVSFLRNYLTRDLVEELDLYLYRKVGQDYKIVAKDWQAVRDQLVKNLTNCGIPTIIVKDGDYKKRGELYLKHSYDGLELDVLHLEKTLPHIFLIWGRQVHLETVIDKKTVLFSYQGGGLTKKLI